MGDSDRELLEKAAKAAGIPVAWHEEAECLMRLDRCGTVLWRPLQDYGDALELAVLRGLDFRTRDGANVPGEFPIAWTEVNASGEWLLIRESHIPDAGSAVRRCIVRAAAIGEST